MIKSEDRRFLNYWEEQRSGSRASYYITYTMAWGVVIFLGIFFLTKLFTNLWGTGGPYLIWIFIASALILSFLLTHSIWTKNEARLKKILKDNQESLN